MNLKGLLPNLPFFNNSVSSEVFFAIDISADKITAGVWMLRGRALQILNTASAPYRHHSELTEAANQALDEALADFEFNPSKVLFGVPDYWLQDDNLKEEYLKSLRKLTKDLDLEPMAFVSMSHAISHFLQKQTGVPTTAVLINYADPLVVSVVKGGKIVGSKEIRRSEDLAFDLEKILLQFDEIEVLPSRILVFGQSKGSGLKEKLVSFPWMSKLPFLHLPKIDLLDESVTIQAVCFAGASELNPDVSYQPQALNSKKDGGLLHRGEQLREDPKQKEQLEKAGFVAGDIENMEVEFDETDVEHPASYVPDDGVFKDFEDGGEMVKRGKMPVGQYGDVPSTGREIGVRGGGLMSWPSRMLGGLTGGGGGLFSLRNLVLGFVVVFLVAGIGTYVTMVKATVSIFIDAKVMEKDAIVIADPSIKEVDAAAKKIPGKVIDVAVNDTGKGSASGNKQIGDPAKGKVIIYNKTDSSKNLAKGTVLSSTGGQKFSLDSGVAIASQSAQPGPNFQTIITPGKSDSVGVTAQVIGPDGNLPAGTNLAVSGFNDSQVIAQIDTAFSGGTSKNIMVVTADDQKKLLAQVASSLRQKAQDAIQGKLTGDMKILQEGLQENITSQNFSKNVGDQASEFTLALAINFKGTAYSDGDLKTIVAKSSDTSVPEGYELNLADSQTQAAANSVDKEGKLTFNAKFLGKLVPIIDQEKLKKEITGKSVGEAVTIIKRIENVIGVEAAFKPKLPGFLQRIPFMTKNISLEVMAK